ncbi:MULTISPECIES: hypothetical protein [unclassified Streptomyces]|uniref:hypothetical protein n=1 Tax=unclassified Streptomyces TaxID=2593676 RepID=UPI0033EF2008
MSVSSPVIAWVAATMAVRETVPSAPSMDVTSIGEDADRGAAFVGPPWAWPGATARRRSWPAPPPGRLHERLDLRAQVQPAADLIRSATTTAARLLREEGRVGTLAVGAQAYCWSRGGSPLEDMSVLTKPREHLRHVIKAGTPM